MGGGTFVYNFRVYTLRDDSKRTIKLKEGESFEQELQRVDIQETLIKSHLLHTSGFFLLNSLKYYL
ncbi:hypothetical protein COL23_13665 [Priestia aryabhattai]|nr:hypothetical protein COL23_13665 [Priestia aryabhattai]